MSPTPETIKAYIAGPAFHIRPGNTDWQYLQMLCRLPEFAPELLVERERFSLHSLIYNLRYAGSILQNRLNLPIPEALQSRVETRLPAADLRASASDVVYAYGSFPSNAAPVPVIYHTGAIDAEHLLQIGRSQKHVEALQREQYCFASASALLTANSYAALDNLTEFMPDMRKKMRMLPFFLPHLQAADKASIQAKFESPERIEMLFVGREARRKGLPEVLDAFQRLNAELPRRLRLTIVSTLIDGAFSIPTLPNLRHIRSIPREQVQQLMRSSHLLLMPSHFESYGWVYLEAMAAGTIPLATDRPIQREILDGGRAGILTRSQADAIAGSLRSLVVDQSRMQTMATAAWSRFKAAYSPEIAAAAMREVFLEAKQMFCASRNG